MAWQDEGFVLASRPLGENHVILTVFTPTHGRHLGVVHGGRSPRKSPQLQLGNQLLLHWRGRSADQLGYFQIELVSARSARILSDPTALLALETICVLLHRLPEREPHPGLYRASLVLLDSLLTGGGWEALLARWELGLLEELGFGLDLSRCAATGQTQDLVYVSPKSGRAVSRDAGAPYRDRLLPLPSFLLSRTKSLEDMTPEAEGQKYISPIKESPPGPQQIKDALRLTGFFLEKYLYAPHGEHLPEIRHALYKRLFG